MPQKTDAKKSDATPLIGYARVSTQGQDLTQQRVTLRDIGCTRIFEEKISGAKRERPELGNLLGHLRAGDVVTVTRLDRLARSTRDLLEIAERIKEAGAGLRSLAEPWADTTTPAGRMVLTVFAGMADFERSLFVERTGAGRIAAIQRALGLPQLDMLTRQQPAFADIWAVQQHDAGEHETGQDRAHSCRL